MARGESQVGHRPTLQSVGTVPDPPAMLADPPDTRATEHSQRHVPPAPVRTGHGHLRAQLVGVDVLATLGAWAVATAVWARFTPQSIDPGVAVAGTLVATALTILLVGMHRLYRARMCAVRTVEATRLGRSVLFTAVAMLWMVDMLDVPVSWVPVAFGGALSLVALLIGRSGYRRRLTNLRLNGVGVRPVIMIGGDEDAVGLLRLTREHPEYGYVVRGIVADPASMRPELASLPWLGEPEQAEEALRRTGAAGALIAGHALPSAVFNKVVRRLSDRGYHVQISNGLQGISHNRLVMSPVAHEPLYYLEGAGFTSLQLAAKRALDVTLSVLALVVLAPVLAAVALTLRLTEGSPVLFRQQRMGRNDQPFTLLKFRTMVTDAEDRLAELAEANARNGPLFKMAGDPRVTRLGRFLRATSLDELPQFVNVLRGEMSLVGPRPALPSEVAQFGSRLRTRTRVRPGITGLWQLEARDNPSFWSYERLDLFYVENWSVGLDLSILSGTALTVIRRGAAATKNMLLPKDKYVRQPQSRVAPEMLD